MRRHAQRRFLYRTGFSLLELSIVITIIALLAGGVFAGRSLMESARLNRVIYDASHYISAVNTFTKKYEELPGDMTRATKIWGAASNVSAMDCILTNSSGSLLTCNGDGNGLIHAGLPCPLGTEAWCYSERYRAWQHLTNAGLIKGSFSGIHALSQSWQSQGGVNTPQGPYNSTGFGLAYYPAAFSHPDYFDNPTPINILFYGVNINGPFYGPSSPLLPAKLFWMIDKKMDDGLPGPGKVVAFKQTAAWDDECSTSNDIATARYAISTDERRCGHLMFKIH